MVDPTKCAGIRKNEAGVFTKHSSSKREREYRILSLCSDPLCKHKLKKEGIKVKYIIYTGRTDNNNIKFKESMIKKHPEIECIKVMPSFLNRSGFQEPWRIEENGQGLLNYIRGRQVNAFSTYSSKYCYEIIQKQCHNIEEATRDIVGHLETIENEHLKR